MTTTPTTITINRKGLEAAAWANTHRDYKGVLDGVKGVLHFVTGKGTCIVALSELTIAELADKAGVNKQGAKYLAEYEAELAAAKAGGPMFHPLAETERRIANKRRMFKLAGIDPTTGL